MNDDHTYIRAAVVAAVCIALGAAIWAFLTPPHSHYLIALEQEEVIAVGQPVLIDNEAEPIGRVVSLEQHGGHRAAKIELRERGLLLPQGVEREAPGTMKLSRSNVGANAALLAAGSLIPTRSPAARALAGLRGWLGRIRKATAEYPAVAAVIALALIAAFARVFSARPVTALLVAAGLLGAAVTVPAAVKRSEFENRLQPVERALVLAEQENAMAARLAAAGLVRESQEAGVRALLHADSVGEAEPALTALFRHLSGLTSEQNRRNLEHRLRRLAPGTRAVADSVAKLPTTPETADRIVMAYFRQRARIRDQISRDTGLPAEFVIARLRDLARYPEPLTAEEVVHWANVSDCRMSGADVILPDGSLISRTPAPAPAKPVPVVPASGFFKFTPGQTVILLGSPVPPTTAKPAPPVPAPAHQPPPAAVEPQSAPDITVRSADTQPAPAPVAPKPAPLLRDNVEPPVVPQAAPRGPIIVTLSASGLIALIAFLTWLFRAGRIHAITLAATDGTSITHEVAADEAVVLDQPPRVDQRDADETLPRISVTWLGARIIPGTSRRVEIGGSPVEKPLRIRPGDILTITADGAPPLQFHFLACEPLVPAAGEADTQPQTQ